VRKDRTITIHKTYGPQRQNEAVVDITLRPFTAPCWVTECTPC